MTTLERVRAEIAEYGSIWVQYYIKGHTDTDIDKLVEDVLQQAKSQVLAVIDKYAEQEQTGHWKNKEFRKEEYVLIGKCSVCGRGRVIDGLCSYCGCRMVEPQESEEQPLSEEIVEHYKKLAEHYNGGTHESIQDTDDGK